jgi:glutaredoxin
MAERDVELFTLAGGPFSTQARDFLRKWEIPFREHDTTYDQAAIKRMGVQYGASTFPLLVIDGKVMATGFSKENYARVFGVEP